MNLLNRALLLSSAFGVASLDAAAGFYDITQILEPSPKETQHFMQLPLPGRPDRYTQKSERPRQNNLRRRDIGEDPLKMCMTFTIP